MRFEVEIAPAKEQNVFVENDLRISVLSNMIIRVEKGAFTDLRSQTVVCRNFSNPQFRIDNGKDKVLVVTKTRVFEVDKNALDVSVNFIAEKREEKADNKKNLGGTARTLDGTFGLLGGWKGKREKKDQ